MYLAFTEELKASLPTVKPEHILLTFYESIKSFEDATKCFDATAYEATVVMLRAAIDNAVYEAVSSGKSVKNPKYVSEFGIQDGEESDIISIGITDEFDSVGFDKLKEVAFSLGILKADEAHLIKIKIREKGHFSAHSAQRRQQEKKLQTSPEEAIDVLMETKKYLTLIIQRFYQNELGAQ